MAAWPLQALQQGEQPRAVERRGRRSLRGHGGGTAPGWGSDTGRAPRCLGSNRQHAACSMQQLLCRPGPAPVALRLAAWRRTLACLRRSASRSSSSEMYRLITSSFSHCGRQEFGKVSEVMMLQQAGATGDRLRLLPAWSGLSGCSASALHPPSPQPPLSLPSPSHPNHPTPPPTCRCAMQAMSLRVMRMLERLWSTSTSPGGPGPPQGASERGTARVKPRGRVWVCSAASQHGQMRHSTRAQAKPWQLPPHAHPVLVLPRTRLATHQG